MALLEHAEILLGAARQAERSLSEFQRSYAYFPEGDPRRNWSQIGANLLRIRRGEYKEATSGLADVLRQKSLTPEQRKRAALLYRVSKKRAAGRAERAAVGIPRGRRLNPECAALALHRVLLSSGARCHVNEVKLAVQVTSFGNSLKDLIRAAQKFERDAYCFRPTRAALLATPKPLVVHIERERFVCVTHADSTGVTYICEDCGDSGKAGIHLSWDQWEKAVPSVAMAVVQKGSAKSLAFSLLEEDSEAMGLVASAVATGADGFLQAWQLHQAMNATVHLLPSFIDLDHIACGGWANSIRSLPWALFATDGDPVNLATGEEQQSPEPDLFVYNPAGPSVVFGRQYHSQLINYGGDAANYWFEPDFSEGWTHNYDFKIYDGRVPNIPQLVESTLSLPIVSTGTAATTSGTWQIWRAGSLVASSGSPNGWNLGNILAGQCRITPATASKNTGYEARWRDGATPYSASFDVHLSSEVASGNQRVLSVNGSTAPSGSLDWQVLRNGAEVGSSALTRGWKVADDPGGLSVYVPFGATSGSGYEVRRKRTSPSLLFLSAAFAVLPGRVDPSTAGPKYLVFPNGSRVALNPPSVPTAGQPEVICGLEAGAPLQVKWIFDANNVLGRYEMLNASGDRWSFIPAERSPNSVFSVYVPKRMTDSLGNWIELDYWTDPSYTGPLPLVRQVKNQVGTTLLLVHRQSGAEPRIVEVEDPYSRSIYYRYSLIGGRQLLTGVSHIAYSGSTNTANSVEYDYFSDTNLYGVMMKTVRWPSPSGTGMGVIHFEYDLGAGGNGGVGGGWVRAEVDQFGNRREYTEVDATTTRVDQKNASGTVNRRYSMKVNDRMSPEWYRVGNETTNQKTFEYLDALNPHMPSKVIDGNGRATSFAYGNYGRLSQVTDNRGVSTNFMYSYAAFPLGRLTSVQRGALPGTSCTYFEPSGNLQSITYPAPDGTMATEQYTYDTLGNLLSRTGPGPNGGLVQVVMSYTTDGTYTQVAKRGQPVRTTTQVFGSTQGISQGYRYDAQGRVTQFRDAQGRLQNWSYNIAGKPLSCDLFSGGSNSVLIQSQWWEYTSPSGYLRHERAVDKWGTPMRTVTYSYDPYGRIASVGGSVEAVTYSHDAAGDPIQAVHGNDPNRTYGAQYDLAGRPTVKTFPGGQQELYTLYDAAGNLRRKTDLTGRTVNYLYNDANGNLSNIKLSGDPSMDVTLDYDAYDRLASIQNAEAITTYVYGPANEVVSRTTTYAGLPPVTLSYTYNKLGSRTSMASPAGTTSYVYDDYSRPISITTPQNQTTTWSYYNDSQVQSQTTTGGLVSNYEYDGAGRLRRLQNLLNGQTISDFSNLEYDAANNLVGFNANIPANTALSGTFLFDYDGRNRLVYESKSGVNGYTRNYGLDNFGNLTTYRGTTYGYNSKNQHTGSGYVFDGNGNPTTWKGLTHEYDPHNRLTAVRNGGTTLQTAGYDPQGRRAWKQVGSQRTYTIYDSGEPVLEVGSNGVVNRSISHGPTGPISTSASGTTTQLVFDPFGNTAHTVANSAVQGSFAYEAFGTLAAGSSTPGSPWASFSAQQGLTTDPETGYAQGAGRYYDPSRGRWLTQGPSNTPNPYTFAWNSPSRALPLGVMTPPSEMLIWAEALEQTASQIQGFGRGASCMVRRFGGPNLMNQSLAFGITFGADSLASVFQMGNGLGTFSGHPTSENIMPAVLDVAGIASFVAPTAQVFKSSGKIVAAESRAAKAIELEVPPQPKLSPGEIIKANRARHEARVAELRTHYEELGYTVVTRGKGMAVKTSHGRRIPDMKLYDEQGKLICYVEVKTGNAQYGGMQLVKDREIFWQQGVMTVVK